MEHRYPIISADSHLQVAAERWTPHIQAKYRDQAPTTARMPDGTDATVIGGKPFKFKGGLIGMPYEGRSPVGGQFDSAPGAGSAAQRLREQDQDGVDAEILFTAPEGVSFYKGIKDTEAFKATIHGWNEFLAEEYCAEAPDRLLGIGILPDTGLQDAIDELEYCARAGLAGVALSQHPSGEDVSRPEDDRFWATALDLNMPLTAHVSFNPRGSTGPARYPYDRDLKQVSSGVDPFSKFNQYAVRGAGNALQMVFGGVFDRFPALRFYFAETQIGWIPHFLDILDEQYDRTMPWAARLTGMKKLDRMPSEYIREYISWGFMRNAFGVRVRHEIGVPNIMWATDFPHAESDWPKSRELIDEVFADVPEDERRQILSGNAIEFFHLDQPAEADSAALESARHS
ncbi:MAG: amidohydrolase family protein [Planctomycetota bacterium]|nr:amidohydrolase family protein [Planctomycetota bacterium]